MTNPPRIGFTAKQAARAKDSIDRDMAKIEDAAWQMRKRVGDISMTTASPFTPLEELREVADELKAIIDRRTVA